MAFGNVGITTFTKAEIDAMLKKAVYSNGKVVWTGTAAIGSIVCCKLVVPASVDYIVVTFPSGKPWVNGDSVSTSFDAKQSLARGTTINIAAGFKSYIGDKLTTGYSTLSFSSDGSLTSTYGADANFPRIEIQLTGYQYY